MLRRLLAVVMLVALLGRGAAAQRTHYLSHSREEIAYYPAGHRPHLPIDGVNITDVTLTVRTLPNLPPDLETAVSMGNTPVVLTQRIHLGQIPKNRDLDVNANPELALDQEGVYLVTVDGGQNQRYQCVVSISRLYLVAKLAPREVLVFAYDQRANHVAPGCHVTLSQDGKPLKQGVTGKDGVVRLPLNGPGGKYRIVGQLGNSQADAAGAHDPPKVDHLYVYTDRPVYRPGQTVSFKALWRKRPYGATEYENVPNRPVTVEIKDSVGSLISRQKAVTSEFGTVSGQYTLTSEPPLGAYSVVFYTDSGEMFGSFKVEEYRKPDYSVTVQADKKFFLVGEPVTATVSAKYLFGSAVSDAGFRYKVYSRGFSPPVLSDVAPADQYLLASQNDDGRVVSAPEGEFVIQGDGTLDAHGTAHITLPARQVSEAQSLTMDVDVTDRANHVQTGEGSALLATQSFFLSESTEREVYEPGEAVHVDIEAHAWDGTPRSVPVTVQLRRQHDKVYAVAVAEHAQTGPSGKVTVTLKAPEANGWEVHVEAADAPRRAVHTETGIRVATDKSTLEGKYPDAELIPDKTVYSPGDEALLLFTTREAHGQALVLAEGDSIFEYRIVPFAHHMGHLKLKLTAREAPTVHLSVAVVHGTGAYQTSGYVAVRPAHHLLKLGLSIAKTEARPGDEQSVTITTTDERNRPVPAEVSLAVVDEAIFAVAPELAMPIQKFFWGWRDDAIVTLVSHTPTYSAGAFQKVGEGVKIRKKFLDTAHWAPALLTGDDGKLTLKFPFPDNLTTWRLTAVGLSKATQVASARASTVVRKPFMIQVTVPRFLTRGDQCVVLTHVHNETGAAQKVLVHVKLENLKLDGPDTQTAAMAAGETKTMRWSVRHDSTLPPKFTAVATNEKGDATDGEEQGMTAVAWGFPTVTSSAGLLGSDSTARIALTMPAAFDPTAGGWKLRLAPGVPGLVAAAISSLSAQPTDVTDTMANSFYVASYAVDAVRHRHISLPMSGAQMVRQVQTTVPNLYGRQNNDGGWPWFKAAASDPYISAQVVRALVAARQAGYLVDDEKINKGVGYLESQAHPKENLGLATTLLEAVSTVKPPQAAEIDYVFQHRQELDYASQADLGLMLQRLKDARAGQVVADLVKEATQTPDQAFWDTAPEKYDWSSDSVATTARALQAILAVNPKSPLVEPTLRWLMMRRDTDGWGTVRTGSEVALALIDWMATHQESAGHLGVKLVVNGQSMGQWSMDTGDPQGRERQASLRADQLKPGANQVQLTSTGQGSILYFWELTSYAMNQDPQPARDQGLAVNRQYFKRLFNYDAHGKLTYRYEPVRGSVKVGDEILTVVKFASWHSTKYLQVEDPLPAGCEAREANEQELYPTGYEKNYTSRVYFRDQKVVMYQDHAEPRIYLYTYLMRATTPGKYSINPATVRLAYYPEVQGNSTSGTLEITP